MDAACKKCEVCCAQCVGEMKMKSNIKQFYDNFAQEEGEISYFLQRDLIMKDLVAGNKILDVGCGSGKCIELLPQKMIYGIDIADEYLSISKKKGYKRVDNIDLSSDEFPYPNNFFDSIICMEVLEHLFDPIHTLVEINRVLKSDGILIISVPNIGWLPCRLSLLMGYFSDFSNTSLVPSHIRFFTIKRLKFILLHTGFKIIKVYGTADFSYKLPFQKCINFFATIVPTVFASNPVYYTKKYSNPELKVNTHDQKHGLESIKEVFRLG